MTDHPYGDEFEEQVRLARERLAALPAPLKMPDTWTDRLEGRLNSERAPGNVVPLDGHRIQRELRLLLESSPDPDDAA